ncbi:hypothetical protein [Kiritimatiella glycovorans]|uniref:LamG domain-containing protein n=1 Tax=Kiritimatiella glycovorans TaxID=1307763 RepID=A0A0G3EIK6_9BACT|nr:hypothetical protein [Kiritimatiella glycovorans]AKJ65272.1 hypothetical protein L21SP4_02039 [Kiritimatiella glycovorans]
MRIYVIIPAVLAVLCGGAAAATILDETFEPAGGMTNGPVHGQGGWIATNSGIAEVQSTVSAGGSQALRIEDSSAAHALSSAGSTLWLRFHARIDTLPADHAGVTDANTSAAFFVDTNRCLVVYSNTTPLKLDARMPLGEWTRFDLFCDYEDLIWNLSMNGTNIAAGLPLYSSHRHVDALRVGSENGGSLYVDNINVSDRQRAPADAPDRDGDGLPDWWEQKFSGGVTNCNPGALSSNGGLTFRQAFIAGVRPDRRQPFHTRPPGGNRRGLCWDEIPGRRYDVYWAQNLTDSFVLLSNDVPGGVFIDTARQEHSSGYYKLKARVDSR